MAPNFQAFGQPVTVVRRRASGSTDEYGNDVINETRILVPGCAVAPGNTFGDNQGTISALADVIVYMPPGTDVQNEDKLLLPDGLYYWVNGIPKQWRSPFSGAESMLEVPAVVTTGGPQAG